MPCVRHPVFQLRNYPITQFFQCGELAGGNCPAPGSGACDDGSVGVEAGLVPHSGCCCWPEGGIGFEPSSPGSSFPIVAPFGSSTTSPGRRKLGALGGFLASAV